MENIKTNKDNINLNNYQILNQNNQLNKLRTSLKVPLNKEKIQMMESIHNLKEKLSKKNYEKTRGNQNESNSLQKNYNSNAFLKSTESNNQNNTLENPNFNNNLNSNYEAFSQEKNLPLSNSKNNNNNSSKNISKINNNYSKNYYLSNNNISNNQKIHEYNFNKSNSTANYFKNLTMKKFGVLSSIKTDSKNKHIPKHEKNIGDKVLNNATGIKMSFSLNDKNDVNFELNNNQNKNYQNGNISRNKQNIKISKNINNQKGIIIFFLLNFNSIFSFF
jgi:hypothetical protein